MKFDPDTKELFTDDGTFLKRLHCPLRAKWAELKIDPASPHRLCERCGDKVINTAAMSDAQMLSLMEINPDACVSVSAKQANVSFL